MRAKGRVGGLYYKDGMNEERSVEKLEGEKGKGRKRKGRGSVRKWVQ